jgi:hypothetical protein
MHGKQVTGVIAALALGGVAAVPASGDTNEMAQMRAEMAAMRAEMAQLKGDTAYETERLQAATAAALEDARTRINYQADQFVAGHDGKEFALTDPEGNYYWSPNAQLQFRYIWNNRNDDGDGVLPSTDDENNLGFQLRRFKLKGDGWIADPKITFKYSVEFNRDSNAAALEEAVVGYKFDSGVKLQAGRFKGPFAFDELTSSSRQMAVERSLVNEQFTIGKMEGVQLELKPADTTKVRLMVSDGAGGGEGGNGDFNESSADFAVTGRVDFTIGGDEKGSFAKDYTSWAKDEAGINIGAAVHHEVGQTGIDGGVDLDSFTRATADVLYNSAGLSLFGAAYIETQDVADDSTAVEADPFGFLAQAAYNINDTIEPFVRYEWIDTDVAGADEISVVTAGVNYYLKKHKAKFTFDVVHALDPLTGIGVSDSLGLLGDDADEDGQTAFRAQFQLLW